VADIAADEWVTRMWSALTIESRSTDESRRKMKPGTLAPGFLAGMVTSDGLLQLRLTGVCTRFACLRAFQARWIAGFFACRRTSAANLFASDPHGVAEVRVVESGTSEAKVTARFADLRAMGMILFAVDGTLLACCSARAALCRTIICSGLRNIAKHHRKTNQHQRQHQDLSVHGNPHFKL
jgi:hypothetical protein